MRIKLLVLFFGFLCISGDLAAQVLTQDLEGFVFKKSNEKPLANVNVYLISSTLPLDSTITNNLGYFIFKDIEVGRYDISFVSQAYESITKPGLAVVSSKSTFLEVSLKESYKILEEILIIPQKSRGLPNNEMSTLSGISIDAEDARKFAGGLDDPIRAATNMPGINSNGSFSDNFVSIRGNSPRGLKYYFEGIELPNPTHFARIGSAGGTFTIFSLKLLDNSDLFTGAFPAEYSNSSAGIFDVKFRKGNNKKHEFGFQVGTLGIDVSSEGPLKKGSNASYLANFRYATVGLARLIGYPTQPTYTDLSFNLNFPLSDTENLKIYSIIGASDRTRTWLKDASIWEEGLDRYKLVLNSKLLSLGAIYSKFLNTQSLFKASVLGAYTQQQDNRNFLLYDLTEINRSTNEYDAIPFSAALSLKHPFSSKLSLKTGISANYTNHKYAYNSTNDTIIQLALNRQKATTFTGKAFIQSTYRVSEKIQLNPGVNLLYHQINKEIVLEPRIGISYQLNTKQKIAIAYGKHSQAEEPVVYSFSEDELLFPNKQLKSTKSHHFTIAYNSILTRNHRLNIEVYYQQLFDVPVEPNGSFSTINLSELNEIRAFNNSGKGENYGIDIGFERFTDKGLYYLINASWLNSTYLGGDNIWRSTGFDYGYNIRFLCGKEFTVGKRKGKRNLLSFNTTLSAIGGTPYTPVDLEQSAKLQNTIFKEQLAFSAKEKGLIVLDLTSIYQINKSKRSAFWTFQIKNLFSSADAVYREYDTILNKEVIVPSSSFFPVFSYGLEF